MLFVDLDDDGVVVLADGLELGAHEGEAEVVVSGADGVGGGVVREGAVLLGPED